MNRICVNSALKCTLNKKVSDCMNQTLYVEIDVYFPAPLQFGTAPAKNISLFVHTNIPPEKVDSDFGYRETINSLSLLWKTCLDILSPTVFNSCYRYVLPLLVPNFSYSVFVKNRRRVVSNKIKAIFDKDLVTFCTRIAVVSSTLFNPYVIIETFNSYQRGIDFFRYF